MALPPKCLEILLLLVERAGSVVSQDEITDRVWPEVSVEYSNITKNIALIRKELRPHFDTDPIRTYSKRGYQFVPEVEVVVEAPAEASLEIRPAETRVETPPSVLAPDSGRRAWWGLAAFVLVGVAVLVFFVTRRPNVSATFEAIPLTALPGSEDGPSFSPDGTQVAYRGDQDKARAGAALGGALALNYMGGQWDIYAKTIGAASARRLTSDSGTHWYPAWSPDGKWIAFTAQHGDGRNGLFLIPASGGPERLIAEFSGTWVLADWSPDGKWIAVSPTEVHNFDPNSGVTLISVGTGERRELARGNAEMSQTAGGRFSPDGRQLGFLRLKGNFGQLYVADLTAEMRLSGTSRRVSSGEPEVRYAAWSAGGSELLFMQGSPFTSGAMKRGQAGGSGESPKIPGLGITAGPIGVARKHNRMAFSSGGADYDIWRLDITGKEPPEKWIVSTMYEAFADYSRDGKKIVFTSNRSGSREIWVSDADGSNTVQLTHYGGPLVAEPRWSPDGQQIAFDGRLHGNPDLYVMNADGNGLRQLTEGPGEDARPVWSADGKSIFFSSDRSGRSEIWRMPGGGGAAEQVTKNGGASLDATPDGAWLYYRANTGDVGPLRRIRPDGSGDSAAIELPVPLMGFTAAHDGVYFVTFAAGKNRLQRLSTDGKVTNVATLPFATFLGLSLSADGHHMIVTKPDEGGTDLMLVENFR